MEDKFSETLNSLNKAQREAVEHEGSPLLILAGAGSGKTKVITTKIAYLVKEKKVSPYSILAVTFTKKAANEMRQRAVNLEEEAGKSFIKTFHSFGSYFLRKYSDIIGIPNTFTVYDDEEMALLIKEVEPKLSLKEAHTVAKQISLAKDYCLFPEDDLSIIQSEFDLNDIYKKYDMSLRSIGNVDFGDLILMPYLALKKIPIIASEIHNRFKVILVDEYQDSNIAQYKLLQELSGIKDGNDSYICVVGDDDQSIYRFRGAEVQNILSFPKQFEGTKIIRLEQNYRSTGSILNAADEVVKNNVNRLGKTLLSTREEGKKPVLAYLLDNDLEAEFCSQLILKSCSTGNSYNDWAILYRTNAQSLNFEKEFINKRIPYKIVGSLKFYEREEIKDALAYLSFFVNNKDIISFKRIINKPGRGIGEKTQEKIIQAAAEKNQTGEEGLYNSLISTLKEKKLEFTKKAQEGITNFINIFEKAASLINTEETLNNAFEKSGENVTEINFEKTLSYFLKELILISGIEEYHKEGDLIEGTQRIQNLHELVNTGAIYPNTMQGLLDFLDAINLEKDLQLQNEISNDEFVTLITIHNTKGLEFNKVIITGLEQGIFPREDKIGVDLEEERRLFYVGITRAKDELYLTSVMKRFIYGRSMFMEPSIFLSEAKDSFKIIGQKPAPFSLHGYGMYNNSYSNNYNSNEKKSELEKKWAVGTKIFHDDYGYGIITSCTNMDEFVINVSFENGYNKKFMPEYQSSALTIIKD